jgi:hypothetical protein
MAPRPNVKLTGGQWPQAAGRPVERGVSPRSGRSRRRWPPSLAFESIAPGNYLEFAADSVLDRNDGSRLEYESRKHRTKFVNRQRIVTVYQHVTTPLTDSNHEEFNLEIGGRLPLTEYLKDSLLGILVLDGRTLRASNQLITYFIGILLIVLVLGANAVWTG